MSTATISEAPVLKEQTEEVQTSLLQEAPKKDKQKQKKEKEKEKKERKEREKKEKKEKKDRKGTKDEIQNGKSEPASPITSIVNTDIKENGASLPQIDASNLQTPSASTSPVTPASASTFSISSIQSTLPLTTSINQIVEEEIQSPIAISEVPSPEKPPSIDTNLSATSRSLESAIIDATQTNINESNEDLFIEDTSSGCEPTISEVKKNWVNAIGQVRGFLVRTSNTVVEKINQKLDELDEQLMEQFSDEEFIDSELETHEPSVEDPTNLVTEDLPQPVASSTQQPAVIEAQKQREELLENIESTNAIISTPPPLPPKDPKYTHPRQELAGTQSVMSENMNALIERGEKMDQLNDKMEGMSNASSEFARIAREMAKREANKKWYNIW
ncbi:hypothetical protein G9A89_019905 [Geosiphon pyriformis]|nr:hypothetical protein G9A89_019905 [Geosiphon pyriformis]